MQHIFTGIQGKACKCDLLTEPQDSHAQMANPQGC